MIRRATAIATGAYCTILSSGAFAANPEPLVNTTDINASGHEFVINDSDQIQTVPTQLKAYVGRLYFQLPDGTTHYCSAQYVDSQVVLTAAHCIQPIKDDTSFCYIPRGQAYGEETSCHPDENGNKVTCIAKNPNYDLALSAPNAHAPDKFYIAARYDWAFLRMETPSGLSSLDIHENKGNDQDLFLAGYPAGAASPKEPTVLNLNSGGFLPSTDPDDNAAPKKLRFVDVLHPKLMAAGTRDFAFGPGVSGGAWFLKKSSGNFYIISLSSSYSTSTHAANQYRILYGPSFDPRLDPKSDLVKYRAAAKSNDATLCK